MRVELLYDIRATLGEGPVWDARAQTLYWIDILHKRVYANADVLLELNETVGCLAPRKSGGIVFTKRFSFWTFETDSSQLTPLATLTREPAHNRFNDGKCDPRGRFLAGTMDMGETDPNGSLYSFDGKTISKLLGNVTISNGMTWGPDYKTFYHIDTPTRTIRAFDYDLETGTITSPREAVSIPESFGWPDGMTSDLQGNLWVAMWGGAQITKWNPDTGQLLERIPLPAKNVSSCVFGGTGGNDLFVTSARVGLDEAALREYPLTGAVFRITTKTEGMPVFEFAG
ncbi:MAG: SMP-30/gluconolactonase/LRE family protein [Chloroflexi bacterium]|nr:SMP-30/gluconolactonase/LRE family protein [Chloroflexota bacterium]